MANPFRPIKLRLERRLSHKIFGETTSKVLRKPVRVNGRPKPYKSRTVLTAADKIKGVERRKKNATSRAVRPVPMPKIANNKRKMQSFLPPDEALHNEEADKNATKRSRKKRPTTTRDRTEVAQAAKRTRGLTQISGRAVAEVTSRCRSGSGGMAAKATHESVVTPLKSHKPTSWDVDSLLNKPPGQEETKGVLFRPTERTKRLQMKEIGSATRAGEPVVQEIAESEGPSRLMGLSKEVRARIWKCAVFRPDFFVWPDSITGREQPDLAMVCRQVRVEVLPLFYALNTFAIDVSPSQTLKDLAAFGMWYKALEPSGAFARITRLAFVYSTAVPTTTRASSATEDNGKNFVVLLELRRDEKNWLHPFAEVHREARCALPASETCGTCLVRKTPRWLNETLEMGGKGCLRAGIIMGLAKVIQQKAASLVDVRCKPFARWP